MMNQPVMVIYVSLDLITGQRILTLSEATEEKGTYNIIVYVSILIITKKYLDAHYIQNV